MLDTLPDTLIPSQGVEEEIDRLPFPLLEVGGTAHCPDTHDTIRQGNHPHPAVLEPINADVARILAGTAPGSAEVAEYSGALVLVVLTAQPLFGGQKRIATRRIHYVLSRDTVTLAILRTDFNIATTRIDLLDRNHLVAFPRIRSGCTRVVEQHLVEVPGATPGTHAADCFQWRV